MTGAVIGAAQIVRVSNRDSGRTLSGRYGVTLRTVRRWASGTTTPPEWVLRDMLERLGRCPCCRRSSAT